MTVAAAVETERRRISEALHDRIGPNLATVAVNLRIIEERNTDLLSAELLQLLRESQHLLAQAVGGIRELSGELRPARLEYAGLEAALADFAQQFRYRTGLDARFTVSIGRANDGPQRLAANLEWLLYRVIQEALSNCARHAQAASVRVDLRRDGDALRLQISDDGVGFDPDSIALGEKPPGLGLLEMRERVEQAQGTFTLASRPGQGTQIDITVPASVT